MNNWVDVEKIIKWDAAFGRDFPARMRRKQKRRFVQNLKSELNQWGFETEEYKFKLLLENHVLATDCLQPKIIFLAHYDTPTIIPFWMAWIFQLFGHTRQISAMVFMLGVIFGGFIVSNLLAGFSQILDITFDVVNFIFLLSIVAIVIPNPRNREDNTSGVIGLLTLADWIKDQPDLKRYVQFVFLDNEEWGLLGSKGLKDIWDRNGHPYGKAHIINLDCISRGQNPLIVHHGKTETANTILPFIQKHIPDAKIMNMNIIPLSDNFTFKEEAAVDISFADRTIIPGGYYIPKIHSPADKDIDAEHMGKLIQALADFIQYQH